MARRPAQSLDGVIRYIRAAAEAGKRCPTTAELKNLCLEDGFGFPFRLTLPFLARRGVFRIEVYGKNHRVVFFPDGVSTAKPTGDPEPYLIIDENGRTDRTFAKKRYTEPTMPEA